MGRAEPRPQDERASELLGGVTAEVAVRHKNDRLVRRIAPRDLDGVGGGHATVALGLDLGRAVDIAEDLGTGMLRLEGAELLAGDHVGHRAAGIRGRQQHRLAGIEDRGGLSHKVDAAEHNDIRLDVGCLAGQLQRIAGEVSDVLHLPELVVVCQDNG